MKNNILVLCLFVSVLTACQGQNFAIAPAEQNFNQSILRNNKVDIIWIMDNSSSMQKHQSDLSAQVPDLVAKLNSLKMDYHMAVITTSMGGSNPNGGHFIGSPRILTNSTANLASVLTSRLVVGQDGSDNERGLDSLEAVLSSSYLANEGAGFLRDDAYLAVIALSDEDDKSHTSSTAVSYYTNLLDGVKKPWTDGSRAWMMNFIGVLSLTSQCKTYNDYAEPGLTYMGLASASGGNQESICTSDMTGAVSNIRSRIVQVLTDYALAQVPNISTIVVTMNGVVVPHSNVNGWDYISSTNVIRFYGTAIPAADVDIKVTFTPATAQ
jgi:hypothetical protein